MKTQRSIRQDEYLWLEDCGKKQASKAQHGNKIKREAGNGFYERIGAARHGSLFFLYCLVNSRYTSLFAPTLNTESFQTNEKNIYIFRLCSCFVAISSSTYVFAFGMPIGFKIIRFDIQWAFSSGPLPFDVRHKGDRRKKIPIIYVGDKMTHISEWMGGIFSKNWSFDMCKFRMFCKHYSFVFVLIPENWKKYTAKNKQILNDLQLAFGILWTWKMW